LSAGVGRGGKDAQDQPGDEALQDAVGNRHFVLRTS
jgi:hypothetical protein